MSISNSKRGRPQCWGTDPSERAVKTIDRRVRILVVLVLCAGTSGCKLLHPPVISALVYPFWQPSSDSIDSADYNRLVADHREALAGLRLGVVRNPHRTAIGPSADGARKDENVLLRDFLEETELFDSVVLVDDLETVPVDYAISASADCIFETSLDSWTYTFNWMLLGVGFLLGIPYQDTTATYLVESVFYESDGTQTQLAGASIAFNQREWYGQNLYWKPKFYSAKNLEPLFEQVLYDFLLESGCLQ